ncbi:hypothetical protein GP486_008907, partial [Trichoglossum hirsutum]
MAIENPYDILGVPRNATKEEIEKAFKAAVKKHHPDNGGDEKLFNKVVVASLILRDDEKRKKYDEDGIYNEERPDTTHSLAMEQVAMFFINSIEALVANSQNLANYDLIQ